jgi:hypothetical protein
LQTVETSEYGAVYMDASGNVVFQDRALTSSSIAGTPTVFADDGTGLEYANVRWVLDDSLVYNKASITATGLATQTAIKSGLYRQVFFTQLQQRRPANADYS